VKRLLVFQHVAHEILGTLDPLLKRAGFRIRYVNFSRQPDAQPSLDGYDGLIILGGPMSVNDSDRLPHLGTEMHLIEQAMKRDLPLMGICLGAQLIAKALGAAVYPNREKKSAGTMWSRPTLQKTIVCSALGHDRRKYFSGMVTRSIFREPAGTSPSLRFAPIKLSATARTFTGFNFTSRLRSA
jgi:anthranilate/para-aminobenzoate synthase component II